MERKKAWVWFKGGLKGGFWEGGFLASKCEKDGIIIENFGGCSDTIIKNVCVENDYVLHIPNAFTPLTQDNINDRFSPYGFGIKKIKL